MAGVAMFGTRAQIDDTGAIENPRRTRSHARFLARDAGLERLVFLLPDFAKRRARDENRRSHAHPRTELRVQ